MLFVAYWQSRGMLSASTFLGPIKTGQYNIIREIVCSLANNIVLRSSLTLVWEAVASGVWFLPVLG